MTVFQSKYSAWLIHITAWAAIIGMPLFVIGTDRPLISGGDYLRFLVVPVSFMIVFYINFFHLIEKHLFTRHVLRFLLCNTLLICIVMGGVHLLFRYILTPDSMPPPPSVSWQGITSFLTRNALLYMLVVGVSVAIRMTGSWYRAETARQELEHIHTQAELQNLKSQLNPHFLFNTLNNIYSLIQTDTVQAQRSVHNLSRMLRYVLYDSSRPTVPLRDEVRFLHDYIELMRIRLPRHVRLLVSLPETPSETPIAPLLFISLVENAFKHGVSNEKSSYIMVDLHEVGGKVTCLINNSLFPKSVGHDDSGSGIGLTNLSKRLEMIYPGRYRLEYGAIGDTDYRAELSLNMNI